MSADGRLAAPGKPRPELGAGPDLLQELLVAGRLAGAAPLASPAARADRLRLVVEDSVSEQSRARVRELLVQAEQLRPEERLLLYLKLPAALASSNGAATDPLRQPLNPLGNRYEIHQTIMWIKTHLEEDPEVSLPKQEVYDEYNIFCSKNSMKPLSTADFGKVMKQVYPRVRPRRLGTRGNSRYCYAGMRKRIKLDPPVLPAACDPEECIDEDGVFTEEMLGAASTLVREWAEKQFKIKFPTLYTLGKYLVSNLLVDNQSLAAVCILSSPDESGINRVTSPRLPVATAKTGKLREAQLQLQKKIQQRELKHRHSDNVFQQDQHRGKNGDQVINENHGDGNRSKSKKSKTNHLVLGTNVMNNNKLNATPLVATTGRQKKFLRGNNQCSLPLQPNCDNLVVQLVKSEQNCSASRLLTDNGITSLREARPRSSRKRAIEQQQQQQQQQIFESSPEKHSKLAGSAENSGTQRSTNGAILPVILEGSARSVGIEPSLGCDRMLAPRSRSNGFSESVQPPPDSSVESDALNDYLLNGSNSQEPEEELLQYFQQSSSSSSDLELSGIAAGEPERDKVSQLRAILQENLEDRAAPIPVASVSVGLLAQAGSRRRVSFETGAPVPQSPNTRRRIFDFTPISPTPRSPVAQRASAAGSPFVSPRDTPVPRARSGPQRRAPRSASCSAGQPLTVAPAFLTCDLAPGEPQLLCSYPSQENLQEIRRDTGGPAADSLARSRSVPLHRMIDPALLSPAQVRGSATSSVAPTPVPSEFTDFGPLDAAGLLLDTDLLAEAGPDSLFDMLQADAGLLPPTETLPELLVWSRTTQSRSYPSTPGPIACGPPPTTPIVGSKSQPATPLLGPRESGEPMLFNPHALQVQAAPTTATQVECSVADFLERGDLGHDDGDGLDSLGQFDQLQDVATFSPLFTEVVDSSNN